MYWLSCRRFARFFPVLLAVALSTLSANALAQAPTTFQQAWQSGTPATVTGVLTAMIADDFANRRSELDYMIRDDRTGRSLHVHMDKQAPGHWRTGTAITVSGRTRGSEIYVLADEISSTGTTSAGISSESTQFLGPSTSVVTGDQTTLVMVANFIDKDVSCSVPRITDLMFTDPLGKSVDGLYRQLSAGRVSFSGTVVGPYALNVTSTDPCAYMSWSDAMNAAAANSGVDVNAYARKVYMMPSTTCPAAGYAELDKTPSRAWMFVCDYPDVLSHELGHNLGLLHASSPSNEYGDGSDYMGLGRGLFRELSAPHKFQMGWLADSQAPVINQNGQYNIAPLELDPIIANAPQALKAFKSDTNDYYYLSYRRGIGFDTELCCAYLDRLSVHRWTAGTDLTWPTGNTYLLAILADGETYLDPVTGFTVTQLSHNSASSTALVHLGNGCGSAVPSLTLSPRDQSGPSGTARAYDAALVNNDAASCAPAYFSLASTVPQGWAAVLSSASLQVPPGGSGLATLTLTSPVNAASGTYNVVVNVNDMNVPVHAASINGSDTVVPSCTNAPTASISPSTQSAPAGTMLTYSLAVTNRDGTGCGETTFVVTPSPPSNWTATPSSSAVTLAAGASTTLTYSVKSPVGSAPGTYGIWANISDDVSPLHNASGTASYNIQPGDTQPPTAPAALVALVGKGRNAQSVNLSWQPASDNVAVAGYKVWRNGAVIATTTGTSWVDQLVMAGSTYTYSVAAYDAAGNLSASSSNAVVKMASGVKGK